MSVLISILIENTAILAADKRMVNLDTGLVSSETTTKIYPLNKQIAFSSVGNAGVSFALKDMLECGNKRQQPGVVETFRIDDFCDILDECIDTLYAQYAEQLAGVHSMVILAGKNSKGLAIIKWRTTEEPEWATIESPDGALVFKVFNPSDITVEQCSDILVRELERIRNTDKTIVHAIHAAVRQIATYSRSVNSDVDIWICNS